MRDSQYELQYVIYESLLRNRCHGSGTSMLGFRFVDYSKTCMSNPVPKHTGGFLHKITALITPLDTMNDVRKPRDSHIVSFHNLATSMRLIREDKQQVIYIRTICFVNKIIPPSAILRGMIDIPKLSNHIYDMDSN